MKKQLDRINRIERPSAESILPARRPLQFGSYDLKKRNDPPAKIGADTREVLESLGYDESKINELAANKIVAIGD